MRDFDRMARVQPQQEESAAVTQHCDIQVEMGQADAIASHARGHRGS